jgi:hypothetical protein
MQQTGKKRPAIKSPPKYRIGFYYATFACSRDGSVLPVQRVQPV